MKAAASAEAAQSGPEHMVEYRAKSHLDTLTWLLLNGLGTAFLVGQGNEFATLYRHGITLSSSLFGSSFFTLTGFHGLHVLVGICWALSTLVKALRAGYSQGSYLGVEVFGLYWHFVDIVWIILFTLIYLI